jgi:hypothetical protein
MENRFLFVIDNASAMKARRLGIEQAVNSLMESGMKGELRKGDTIGLWTYNDHLDTDFPMEVWTERMKGAILSEVRGHLSRLRYEKRAHLEKALPAINEVIRKSERITVILIFDGSDPIKGTPFDTDINDLHKHYSKEFRSAEDPIVTVLAARDGKVFDYTINYPGTVVLPHTADPLPETNTPPVVAAPTPPETQTPPPPHTNVQIILTGADFAPKIKPQPAPSVAAVPITPPPAPAPAVATNVPPADEQTPVAAPAAQTNVAISESKPKSPSVISAPAPVNTNMARAAEVEPASPATTNSGAGSANTANPAAATTSGELTIMFVIAISLLTIAVVLVLLLLRRLRGGPQASLISQSIDRSR